MGRTNEQQQQQQHPLAIEADAHNKDQHTTKNVLEVNGEKVKLDALGPMIINSDGTMSRITNWQELSPVEQERTVRLLVKKRNLVRMRNIVAEGGNGGDHVTALKEADEADAADVADTAATDEPRR